MSRLCPASSLLSSLVVAPRLPSRFLTVSRGSGAGLLCSPSHLPRSGLPHVRSRIRDTCATPRRRSAPLPIAAPARSGCAPFSSSKRTVDCALPNRNMTSLRVARSPAVQGGGHRYRVISPGGWQSHVAEGWPAMNRSLRLGLHPCRRPFRERISMRLPGRGPVALPEPAGSRDPAGPCQAYRRNNPGIFAEASEFSGLIVAAPNGNHVEAAQPALTNRISARRPGLICSARADLGGKRSLLSRSSQLPAIMMTLLERLGSRDLLDLFRGAVNGMPSEASIDSRSRPANPISRARGLRGAASVLLHRACAVLVRRPTICAGCASLIQADTERRGRWPGPCRVA